MRLALVRWLWGHQLGGTHRVSEKGTDSTEAWFPRRSLLEGPWCGKETAGVMEQGGPGDSGQARERVTKQGWGKDLCVQGWGRLGCCMRR